MEETAGDKTNPQPLDALSLRSTDSDPTPRRPTTIRLLEKGSPSINKSGFMLFFVLLRLVWFRSNADFNNLLLTGIVT